MANALRSLFKRLNKFKTRFAKIEDDLLLCLETFIIWTVIC